MVSLPAQKVAHEVLETMGKGEIPSVRKIAPKHGYSKATAKSGLIQKTKSYRAVTEPVLTRLERLRDKAIAQLESRTLDNERAKDIADMIKGYTHDIQLLGGKATENIAVKPIYSGRSIKENENDSSKE